ncbi:MAG: sigma-70 family RNA polymerase sigma factor [Chloroflexota bacterium]
MQYTELVEAVVTEHVPGGALPSKATLEAWMIVMEGAVARAEPAVESFESFFRQQFGRVYALLYRVTGSAEDAEDLAQELFLQVSRQRPPLWESPTATGWLWKAAGHMALNELRGSRRRRDRETRAVSHDRPLRLVREMLQDPAEGAERREQQQEVRGVLKTLRPRESTLLLLRHSGLSYAAVAQALELNPASVGKLLARAEAHFREQYEAARRASSNPMREGDAS